MVLGTSSLAARHGSRSFSPGSAAYPGPATLAAERVIRICRTARGTRDHQRCGSVYAATAVIASLANPLSTALEDMYATLFDRGPLLPP